MPLQKILIFTPRGRENDRFAAARILGSKIPRSWRYAKIAKYTASLRGAILLEAFAVD
jgi:hypothetical protein